MASKQRCQAVRDEYDKCFNVWLTSFLKADGAEKQDSKPAASDQHKDATPCKALFDAYQACLDVSV